jgi:hypothetical protein
MKVQEFPFLLLLSPTPLSLSLFPPRHVLGFLGALTPFLQNKNIPKSNMSLPLLLKACVHPGVKGGWMRHFVTLKHSLRVGNWEFRNKNARSMNHKAGPNLKLNITD